jgi:hypothetical protein
MTEWTNKRADNDDLASEQWATEKYVRQCICCYCCWLEQVRLPRGLMNQPAMMNEPTSAECSVTEHQRTVHAVVDSAATLETRSVLDCGWINWLESTLSRTWRSSESRTGANVSTDWQLGASRHTLSIFSDLGRWFGTVFCQDVDNIGLMTSVILTTHIRNTFVYGGLFVALVAVLGSSFNNHQWRYTTVAATLLPIDGSLAG